MDLGNEFDYSNELAKKIKRITFHSMDVAEENAVAAVNIIDVTTLSQENYQTLQLVQTQDGTLVTAESIETLNGVVISLAPQNFECISSQPLCGKVLQVIPSEGSTGVTQIIHIDAETLISKEDLGNAQSDQSEENTEVKEGEIISPLLVFPQQWSGPPNAPSWALRMRDSELIGDSYRGWVSSVEELDLLLAYHKQETHSIWGTRQSTGSLRNSLRLMWKSQYVPFDGIPFINAGSRAVVMECRYGPRRKGCAGGKPSDGLYKGEFRQTCPARIYIKKVRKFPEYKVGLKVDKKNMRASMGKAFLDLKSSSYDGLGEDRWYVQLPTESAHEFHDSVTNSTSGVQKFSVSESSAESKMLDSKSTTGSNRLSRIHPQLVEKIRELVSHGETRVFSIRKQLRKFVEKEMFHSTDEIPEKHNLCFFPTIHDIQNHVYEALKDIQTGSLPLIAPTLNIEVVGNDSMFHSNSSASIPGYHFLFGKQNTSKSDDTAENPELQTIVVTLTKSVDQGQAPVISKIEVHLADGTTQVNTSVTQETFEALSKLHPAIFPPGSIIQLCGQGDDTSSTKDALIPCSAATSSVVSECIKGNETMNLLPVAANILQSSNMDENKSTSSHDERFPENTNEDVEHTKDLSEGCNSNAFEKSGSGNQTT